MENFVFTERPWGNCWLHKSMPAWIVYYEFPKVYQAYKVKDYCLPVPKGRYPWSVDNRALSYKGFKTIEDAINAIG